MANLGIGADPRAGVLTMPPGEASRLFGFTPEQPWSGARQGTQDCTGLAGPGSETWQGAWKDYRSLPVAPTASATRDATIVLAPRPAPMEAFEAAKEPVLVRAPAPQQGFANEPATPQDDSLETAEMEKQMQEQMEQMQFQMEQMLAQVMQMLQQFMGSLGFGSRQQH